MDVKTLENLGRWLIMIAQSGRNVEELLGWLAGDRPASSALASLFSKYYPVLPAVTAGGDITAPGSIENQLSPDTLRRVFQDSLKLYGVVSQHEHDDLIKQYEALKVHSREQEKTITYLQFMLEQNAGAAQQSANIFTSLVEQQSLQFQKIMKMLYESFAPGSTNDD